MARVPAEPGSGGDRYAALGPGSRAVGERLTGCLPEGGPISWLQPVEALPAGKLPHSARRPQGQIDAALLGRHQVSRAAERERLDDAPLGECIGDLARPGSLSSGADGQVGSGIELCLDGTEATHDAFHRGGTDRVEQLLPQTPCEASRPVK